MKITSRREGDPLDLAGKNLAIAFRELQARWEPHMQPGETLFLKIECLKDEMTIMTGVHNGSTFYVNQSVTEDIPK